MSRTTFRCDCSNIGFQGELCQTGIVKTPEIPQLQVGVQTDELVVTAHPKENLIFTLVAEPEGVVEFKPSDTFHLYAPRTGVAFQLVAKRSGVVRIGYRIAGADFLEFQQPEDTVVLVEEQSTQRMSSVPGTQFTENNCYQMKLAECPDDKSSNSNKNKYLLLKSSCPWGVSGSAGYISVSTGHMNLPVSLAGLVFQNKDGVQTFRNSGVVTVSRESQGMLLGDRLQCKTTDACAGSTTLNKAAHDFLVKRNIFLSTYLKEFSKDTPWWLSLETPYGYTGFHVNDIQSLIVKDSRIKDLKCANLPAQMSGIYSAAIFQAPVLVNVLNNIISMESSEHACFLKSLCGGGSRTLVSFPKDVSKVIPVGGGTALVITAQGFGFDGNGLATYCRNFSSSVYSGGVANGVERCVRANGWFKGSVSVHTTRGSIDFQGEVYSQTDDLKDVSCFLFSPNHFLLGDY